jgi:hypothetical protein
MGHAAVLAALNGSVSHVARHGPLNSSHACHPARPSRVRRPGCRRLGCRLCTPLGPQGGSRSRLLRRSCRIPERIARLLAFTRGACRLHRADGPRMQGGASPSGPHCGRQPRKRGPLPKRPPPGGAERHHRRCGMWHPHRDGAQDGDNGHGRALPVAAAVRRPPGAERRRGRQEGDGRGRARPSRRAGAAVSKPRCPAGAEHQHMGGHRHVEHGSALCCCRHSAHGEGEERGRGRGARRSTSAGAPASPPASQLHQQAKCCGRVAKPQGGSGAHVPVHDEMAWGHGYLPGSHHHISSGKPRRPAVFHQDGDRHGSARQQREEQYDQQAQCADCIQVGVALRWAYVCCVSGEGDRTPVNTCSSRGARTTLPSARSRRTRGCCSRRCTATLVSARASHGAARWPRLLSQCSDWAMSGSTSSVYSSVTAT